MIAPPQPRVPHVRDGFIVANVGIGTFVEAPAHLHPADTSNVEMENTNVRPSTTPVPHPLQPYRKGWGIERSETALDLHPADISKVEVD